MGREQTARMPPPTVTRPPTKAPPTEIVVVIHLKAPTAAPSGPATAGTALRMRRSKRAFERGSCRPQSRDFGNRTSSNGRYRGAAQQSRRPAHPSRIDKWAAFRRMQPQSRSPHHPAPHDCGEEVTSKPLEAPLKGPAKAAVLVKTSAAGKETRVRWDIGIPRTGFSPGRACPVSPRHQSTRNWGPRPQSGHGRNRQIGADQ